MFKRTGHIRANIFLTMMALLLLASGACTREDWSDCDPLLRIAFSFTRNPSGTEKFQDELTRLDVLIFDSEGRFVKSISDERAGGFPKDYVMNTELPAEGDYTVVAVGNMSGEFQLGRFTDYSQELAAMVSGNRISDLRLMHKQAGAICGGRINDIFIGSAGVYGLRADVTGRCVVPLTKNTNRLEITVSGLQHMTRAAYPTIETELRGRNASYRYDNSLDDAAPEIMYAPFSRTLDGTDLRLDFSVLRLTAAGSLPFTILNNSVGIGDFDLITEILKCPDYDTDEDLDREDTFKIDITFDTAGEVTIEVNGWQTTNSGGIVGRNAGQIKL